MGFPPQKRTRLEDLKAIYVRNLRGELIPLIKLVKIQEVPTNLTIYRENRERSVHVTANIAPGKSQAEALAVAEKITKEILPPGYRMIPSGAAQTFRESFQELLFALVLGIVIAYMILGAQFNSFLHPITVLLALPFSVTGALIALWLSKNTLNLMSFIGILLLMGIVKKNSILLVDFTNQLREEGYSIWDALITACPIRLRPILMTSLSTIAGAIPLALKLGPGGELRAPMAISVIGGVIFSTFFTLFVVPSAYLILTRFESKRRQLEHKETLQVLKRLSAA
jgi:HAE1 family hydrophobic/amphiphilic exporter-1